MENTQKSTFSKWPDRIFGAAVIVLSIAVVILIAYPLYFVVIASISNSNLVNQGAVTLWPKDTAMSRSCRIKGSGPAMAILFCM